MAKTTTIRLSPLLLVASVFLMSCSGITDAFQTPAPTIATPRPVTCFMAKKNSKKAGGKGFATQPQDTASSSATTSTPSTTSEDRNMAAKTAAQSAMASSQVQNLQQQVQTIASQRNDRTDEAEAVLDQQLRDAEDTNQGKRALERLRRERAEQKDAELRRVKQLRETEALLQESPDAAAIPERVAQRMGRRMLPFVGIPLFGSMAAFVGFWYFATYKDLEFQPAAVATTTIVILVSGLLGITYSLMSASWDEDREGDFLGVDEFKRNVGNIKEGLERSKENARIREKMKGLPEAEIEAALRELDQRDQLKRQRTQSLQSKLEDELK